VADAKDLKPLSVNDLRCTRLLGIRWRCRTGRAEATLANLTCAQD
jgi:hypothetical protein